MRKSERIILRNKNGVETKKRYKRDKNETLPLLFVRHFCGSMKIETELRRG